MFFAEKIYFVINLLNYHLDFSLLGFIIPSVARLMKAYEIYLLFVSSRILPDEIIVDTYLKL